MSIAVGALRGGRMDSSVVIIPIADAQRACPSCYWATATDLDAPAVVAPMNLTENIDQDQEIFMSMNGELGTEC